MSNNNQRSHTARGLRMPGRADVPKELRQKVWKPGTTKQRSRKR